MLREPELKQRDSGEYRYFHRHFRAPHEVFLDCADSKAPKVVLIGCKGRGREAANLRILLGVKASNKR